PIPFSHRAYGSPSECEGCGNRPSFWRCNLHNTDHDLTGISHEKFSPYCLGDAICRQSIVAHGSRTCPWKSGANRLNLTSPVSNGSRRRNIADALRLNSLVETKLFRTNELPNEVTSRHHDDSGFQHEDNGG